ncbi:hypothetical protein Ddc_02478 [Ditylenchus destructor]|nr:hypothetical protein Ddc_02478 [Ditylenchus destructor]
MHSNHLTDAGSQPPHDLYLWHRLRPKLQCAPDVLLLFIGRDEPCSPDNTLADLAFGRLFQPIFMCSYQSVPSVSPLFARMKKVVPSAFYEFILSLEADRFLLSDGNAIHSLI